VDRLPGLRRRVYGDCPTMTPTREHELLGGRVTPDSGEPDHRTPHLRWSQLRQDHRTWQRVQYACDLLLQVRIPRWVRQSPLELMGLVGLVRASLPKTRSSVRGPDYRSPALSLGGRSENTRRWAAHRTCVTTQGRARPGRTNPCGPLRTNGQLIKLPDFG
jgi:hypothetical protein